MIFYSDQEFQEMIKKSRATTWRYRRDGLIEYLKFRGSICYTKEQIKAFIKENSIRNSIDWNNVTPSNDEKPKPVKKPSKPIPDQNHFSDDDGEGGKPAEPIKYDNPPKPQF